MKYWLSIILFFIALSNQLVAQQYQLEMINANEERNKQLKGDSNVRKSFTIQENIFFHSNTEKNNKNYLTLLPVHFTQQFNSHHPFGWNDGAMIQAKGYQILARVGAYFKKGFVEGQIAPEFVFATNNNYPNNISYGLNSNKTFSKFFLGQSFLKFNLGKISLGISSQNLFWGPGINSSLVMSNNAPGFFHGFVGTNAPIKTFLGNIEFKVIGAKLTSNNTFGYESNHLRNVVVEDKWRYQNAYIISLQPKWIKGFYVGLIRSSQQYGNEAMNRKVDLFSKFLPAINLPIQKTNNLGDDTANRDQLASVFFRLVFPKSNFELYTEFGKNDYGLNLRDYLMAPSHSSAYIVGMRKLFKKTELNYIQAEAEITQMSESPDFLVRRAYNWYEHWQILQGYTHNNQIIGSGAGFGTNVQTFGLTWINGNRRNGFIIQQLERDPNDRRNKWTDFSVAWMPQWTYKNMILGAKLQLVRSNNYIWEKGNNPFNFHGRLMVQYNFK